MIFKKSITRSAAGVLLGGILLTGCAAPAASSSVASSSMTPSSAASSAMASSMSGPTSSAHVESRLLTAEQAKARMDSGDTLVVLDVRTAAEYAEAHIPGAVLLPNEEIGGQDPAELPDKNAEILVYCRSGNRSAQAAKKLTELGYTNVWDFGGIKDWPYETESGEAEK